MGPKTCLFLLMIMIGMDGVRPDSEGGKTDCLKQVRFMKKCPKSHKLSMRREYFNSTSCQCEVGDMCLVGANKFVGNCSDTCGQLVGAGLLEWTDWGTCSTTCGSGEEVRSRTCSTSLTNPCACAGELVQRRTCNTGPCSICQGGWLYYEGSCYLFGDAPSYYADARSYCQARDSHLVYINNSSENTFLKDTARAMTPRFWWIGTTKENSVWIYGDGSQVTFTDWSISQPSGDGNCAHLHNGLNYKWNDMPCDCCYNASPICEK